MLACVVPVVAIVEVRAAGGGNAGVVIAGEVRGRTWNCRIQRLPTASRIGDERAGRVAGLPVASQLRHVGAGEVLALLRNAIAEVNDAAAEPVLVDELQIDALVGRQCGVTTAKDDGPDE